jgi:hypothetical protein
VARGAGLPQGEPRREGAFRRVLRVGILGVTLLFVVAALAISCALVVYTAYRHDLQNGVFALLLAVLSAQIAINWFLWKDEEE